MLPSHATRKIGNRNVVVKNCIWKQCESITWEFLTVSEREIVLSCRCTGMSISFWSSALLWKGGGSTSSFAFKRTKIACFGSYFKSGNLSYKKFSVGYFELKPHIHTLETSETHFTSCKKVHNRSPLSFPENVQIWENDDRMVILVEQVH